MRRKKHFFISFMVCFLLLNIYALNPGTSQKKRIQKDLRHEVTVTLKLVQVYVTDKKGNPVMDLEKSDFELFDNGKSQTITDFERRVLSLPSVKTEVVQKGTEALLYEKMSRKFFLLFDFAFNNTSGITMAKKAALHFIDTQVNPTDVVGVLTYSSQKGLVLHEYLTTDHSKIREVIHKVGLREALGRAGRLLEELESETVSGGGKVELRRKAREDFMRIGAKEQLKHQVSHFCSAVKDWAKALRYIPGYKNIILFSIGVPNFLMYQTSVDIGPRLNKMNLSGTDTLNIRLRYEKMSRELSASNSPVYAVNAEGLYADFMEREGETLLSRTITKAKQPYPDIAARNRRGESSLSNLAKDSGGQYFGNINDYKKIVEEIQNLTSSYYVLGYYIDEKWDGKYHKIKVKVKRKGCNVFGQRGYFNPKPFNKYTELEKKIHLVDLALSEKPQFEDPVNFPLATLPYSVEKKSEVLMLSKIPVEKMKEVTGEKIEIIFLVFDKQKNIVTYQRMEADNPRFFQDDVFCYAVSPLSPDRYDCRVVIRNLENGRGAVASSSVNIPKTPDLGLRLYPPLLLIPEKNVLYMNATDIKKKEGEEEHSALLNIYPYDATQYSPLVGELKKDTPKLLVMTRCSIFDIPKAEVKLFARLIHQQTGKTIPLSFSSENKYYDNTLMFSLELQTNELQPGRYFLYLFAEEINTQAKAHVITTITVE